jgi:hypothetical protein
MLALDQFAERHSDFLEHWRHAIQHAVGTAGGIAQGTTSRPARSSAEM